VAEAGLPVVVVNDGRILDHNLRHMGRDRSWLYQKLREQGLGSIKEVFLMTLNESGGIYLAPKERQEGRA
jgi:uncharacterized membrane protein YcaP (DUF421 family)